MCVSIRIDIPHRFWGPKETEDESENKEVEALLKTRYITFAGKFEPVKHKCQAPMPNGKLCERQDRFKVCFKIACFRALLYHCSIGIKI